MYYRLSQSLLLTLLLIALASFQANPPWALHVIDNTLEGADGVRLSDVNRDGHPDLIVGWEESGVTRLYFNPGQDKVLQPWHFVEVPSPSVEDALLVDLDQDGLQDIITSSEGKNNAMAVHWAPADTADYDNSEKWHTEVIPATLMKGAWMFSTVMDVNANGQPDLVVGSKRMAGVQGDDQALVGWLEIPDNPREIGQWKLHQLSAAGWIMSLKVLDMNGDGWEDILLSDRKFSTQTGVRWLENPGSKHRGEDAQHRNWQSHTLGQADTEPMFLTVADWDEDGLEDVVCADLNTQAYYYQRKDKTGKNWSVHQIPKASFGSLRGKAVQVADITGDGKKALIMSFETGSDQSSALSGVTAAMYQSAPTGDRWMYLDISGSPGEKFDLLQLIDLNGDGDLDILTCEEGEMHDGKKRKGLGMVWYENPL